MTETGTYSSTATMTRTDVLIRQLNLIVQCTTGSTTFRTIIEKGVDNKWIKMVKILGLNQQGQIRQQIEMEIDWQQFELNISRLDSRAIRINLADSERNWISRVIGQVIDGFNEITEESNLEAIWVITYTPKAMAEESKVDRELGVTGADVREWEEGIIDDVVNQYKPKRLDEVQITWKVITKR